MPTRQEAMKSAKQDTARIAEHVRFDLANNKELVKRTTESVLHYVICGTHIDPDEGYEYVPVNEPLTRALTRRIYQRQKKVRDLEKWLVSSLEAGKSPAVVKKQLLERQAFPTVCLALSLGDLEKLLTELYAKDYCVPCLEGGYFDLLPNDAIIYGWQEELPSEGGVTDRYGASEAERHDGR